MPDAAEPAPPSAGLPSRLDDLQRPLDEGRPEGATDRAPVIPAPRSEADDPTGPDPDPLATPLRAAVPAAAPISPAPDSPALGSAAPGSPASIRSHRARLTLAAVARAGRGALTRTVHTVRYLPGRTARGFAGWARRPTGRLSLSGLTISALLAAAVTTGALVVPATSPVTADPGATAAPPTAGGPPAPPTPVPPLTAPDLTLPGDPSEPLRGWAEQLAERTDIPVVALLGYGYAELVLASTTPQCQLTWTTLAAIGRVESNHGSTGGSTLSSDGRALPPIVGDPLDGQGDRMLIPDTDLGQLDFDTEFDRAVGPMQFIPQTWQLEAVDANGDGIADVHNIHDAALAAGNYLCRGGRDLSTAEDWWAAIHSYNDVTVYANAVYAAANDYGQRSRGG